MEVHSSLGLQQKELGNQQRCGWRGGGGASHKKAESWRPHQEGVSSFHLSLGIGELHIRSSPANVRPISVIFPNPCPVLAREAAMKARGSAGSRQDPRAPWQARLMK